jgi:hypothetical protein
MPTTFKSSETKFPSVVIETARRALHIASTWDLIAAGLPDGNEVGGPCE